MAEEEGEEVIAWEEEPSEILWTNRYGSFDGRRFCLRSFPVWYRWQVPEQASSSSDSAVASTTRAAAPTPSVAETCLARTDAAKIGSPGLAEYFEARKKKHDESGAVFGVDWGQTLGRIELSCPLEGEELELSEEDFVVELSSWELRVTARYYVEGLQRVDRLCGDLYADVHKKLSWWSLVEDDGYGSGRRLHISLAKLAHKSWNGPWFLHQRNPHRKKVYGWDEFRWKGPVGKEDQFVTLPPGDPQDAKNELLASLEPEGLCTGVDFDEEDDRHVYVVLHLDEENLDGATARVPIEELFAADVEDDSLEVFVCGVGYRLCSGKLSGMCRPDATTWEVLKSLRRKVPRNSGIKAPAYYNPALRIKLVKADNARGIWGGAFSSMNGPTFRAPRERMSWTEMMQRALVLAPSAPLVASVKIAEAKRLCTGVESSQDTDSVLIIMHLSPRMEAYAWKYRFDLTTFFAMRVADRTVDMNVVADCEYTMCYGWLGGCCLPDETSWELAKHEQEEDVEAAPKVVAASGRGKRISLDEAISLTQELLEGFSLPNFRHRIRALELEHGQGSSAFRQERQRLTVAVQSRVLPRYGFEGSTSGVMDMVRHLGQPEFTSNPRLNNLMKEVNVMLGVERGEVRPLPDLREDPRLLAPRVFESGKVCGKIRMERTERSELVVHLGVIGLEMSGVVEPMKPRGAEGQKPKPADGQEVAPGKDIGPWLQAEVRAAGDDDQRKLCRVRMRLDELTETIMLDLRLPAKLSWIEDLQADSEEKVRKAERRREVQEPHFAIHVKLVKAPSSRGKWRSVFVRAEPGEPMPDEGEMEGEEEERQEELEERAEAKAEEEGIETEVGRGEKLLTSVGAEASRAGEAVGASAVDDDISAGESVTRGPAQAQEPPLPIALLFPGQGSQYVKMLSAVHDLPPVRAMLQKAEDILGYDLLDLCLRGPEEKLEETRYCQPAIFVAGLAGVEVLRTRREEAVRRASAVAGLSLGEYTALCVAGVLTFEDGLRLVKLRAEAMHDAATAGKQRMLTVAGLGRDTVEELCEAARKAEGAGATCQIANCLFTDGFVVGGTEPSIEALKGLADKAGALQARLVRTAGAFHTPLMAPAEARLAAALEEAAPRMRPPQCTIWMNATAEPVRKGSDPKVVVELLRRQLTSPVLWEQVVLGLIADGLKEFYEVGPLKQLKACMKRIDVSAWKATQNVEV